VRRVHRHRDPLGLVLRRDHTGDTAGSNSTLDGLDGRQIGSWHNTAA
jgi:hypothetical protein